MFILGNHAPVILSTAFVHPKMMTTVLRLRCQSSLFFGTTRNQQSSSFLSRKPQKQQQKQSTQQSPKKRVGGSGGKGKGLGPHPRNSFQGSYDMDRLKKCYPPLVPYILLPISEVEAKNNAATTPNSKKQRKRSHRPTIDFSDASAVRALNTALLVSDYGLLPSFSDMMPADALMPPIPGRAEYIHYIADTL